MMMLCGRVARVGVPIAGARSDFFIMEDAMLSAVLSAVVKPLDVSVWCFLPKTGKYLLGVGAFPRRPFFCLRSIVACL